MMVIVKVLMATSLVILIITRLLTAQAVAVTINIVALVHSIATLMGAVAVI